MVTELVRGRRRVLLWTTLEVALEARYPWRRITLSDYSLHYISPHSYDKQRVVWKAFLR